MLLDYILYVAVRRRWKENMDTEHADMYEAIRGYELVYWRGNYVLSG